MKQDSHAHHGAPADAPHKPGGTRASLGHGDRDEWQQPERVLSELGLHNGLEVAEFGCGYGFWTFSIAKAVAPGGKLYATEASAERLHSVREEAAAHKIHNLELLEVPAGEAGLPPQSVDLAFSCNVVHEVAEPDRRRFIAGIAKALRPGALLYLIDPRKNREVPMRPYEDLLRRRDLVAMLRDTGLVLDAEYHYLRYQVYLRMRKPE